MLAGLLGTSWRLRLSWIARYLIMALGSAWIGALLLWIFGVLLQLGLAGLDGSSQQENIRGLFAIFAFWAFVGFFSLFFSIPASFILAPLCHYVAQKFIKTPRKLYLCLIFLGGFLGGVIMAIAATEVEIFLVGLIPGLVTAAAWCYLHHVTRSWTRHPTSADQTNASSSLCPN